jgi:hypothetical protein
MSLRVNFRIRSRESSYAVSKRVSIQPETDNWFDYIRQRKLNCRKTLDESYGNISMQQAQLRSVIRGTSADGFIIGKENSNNNNTNETDSVDPTRKSYNGKDFKSILKTLAQMKGELVPTHFDNSRLNQQLVKRDNDPIWNRVIVNSRQPQVLIHKSLDVTIAGHKGCCLKITKMHKKYILKVFDHSEKYGLVLNKVQWEQLWKKHSSYESILNHMELKDGKIIIGNIEPTEDCRDSSKTCSQPAEGLSVAYE